MISVVTVCLNAQEFIEQCIQSVLNQGFDDFEYVIIDGGSTDGTVEIIKKYESKLAYWHSQPDRGLAHAFNLGVEHSSGQWLLFLNSDDYFASNNALLKMADHLTRRPSSDVVFGQVDVVTREQITRKIGGPYGAEFQWKKFCLRNTIPHQAAFSSRAFIERAGPFSEEFRIAVDYEHFLRTGPTLDAVFIPILIANMRFDGLSQKCPYKSFLEWYRAQMARKVVSKWRAQIQFVSLVLRAYLLRVFRKVKG